MKELYTGNLYWPETVRHAASYKALTGSKKTKVAIIGGGMSGILCGYMLAASGIPAALLERGQISGGSTAANTGLLQYSNDVMLSDLIRQIGREDAVAFYRACRDSIDTLEAIAENLGSDVGFKRRSSLYYASTEQDLPKLKTEYETLKAGGFDVEYWSADDISTHFPFRKPGAIVTHGDAEINPISFVHALGASAAAAGLDIYEQTEVTTHDTLANGFHSLRTADGHVIEAEHVIYAVGYEPEELRGKLIKANLNRSFALVTDVQNSLQSWHGQYLIWETARPYLYMRTTNDGRAIIGGLDEEQEMPLQSERALRKRTEKLIGLLRSLFPQFQAPIAYEWCATFGESRDNLPFIGEDPKWSNVYYSLGYGGNGTVYSLMAAHLLRDHIVGKTNPIAGIVRLDRKMQESISN